MKNWFLIPMAAIVGVIAGSWGPREDLERFKEKVQEDRSQKKVSGAAGFDAFAHLASIPDIAKRQPKPKPRTNLVARAGGVVTNAAIAAAEGRKFVPEEPKANRRWSREDLGARLEEAADLWNTRVEIAKTQWKDKLGMSDDNSSTAFDSAVAAMNEALRDTMETLADEIVRAGKMTPELGLRMMGDITRSMAEAYDVIGAAVPPERRAEVSDLPVHEFIDPMVAEPLIGVQDKLDGRFGFQGGTR